MTRPGAHTKLYCIFGSPVRHSLSPRMHNAAFQFLGIDAVYLAFEPASAKDALAAMRALPIHGASVTIPFKTSILPLLDEVDGLARKTGSVNTLVFGDGRISGHTTDGIGALRALTHNGIPCEGRRVLVLGNGGSARSISFALLEGGARVVIAGRSDSRVRALSADLALHYGGVEQRLLAQIDTHFMQGIDLVINTTPVGMYPDDGAVPMDTSLLSSRHAVMDIVYSPPHTRFLREAALAGCTTIGGIDMLLFQGARQFELWTGLEAPEQIMRNVLNEAVAGK